MSNMISTIQSPDANPPTNPQTAVWLRALLTVAWADGHLDPEEQGLIATLTQHSLAEPETTHSLDPVTPAELAAVLKSDPALAENFLRMAVMVALVDRSYSQAEDDLLQSYCQALDVNPDALNVLRSTLSDLSQEIADSEPTLHSFDPSSPMSQPNSSLLQPLDSQSGVLEPVRTWLDQMAIHDPKIAHFLCKMIPAQCPFERDVKLFGRKVVHIPAMCKLNPLYDQFVGLRFRALSYLADDCGEDVTPYC